MTGLVFVGHAQGEAVRNAWMRDAKEHDARAKALAGLTRPGGHPLTPEQQALLADIERQLRNPKLQPATRTCPECAQRFVIVQVGNIAVDYCTRCKGCFFDPGELMAITHQPRDIPALNPTHRHSRLRCPVCGEVMWETTFQRNQNLLVDRCPKGHGIYLQHGELERALRVA